MEWVTNRRCLVTVLCLCSVFRFVAGARAQQPAPIQQPLPAEPAVAAANKAVLSQLPFQDRQDFEDAERGFIATSSVGHNPDLYRFLAQDPPPTVNPSLWRQAQLNEINGLFKVSDGEIGRAHV